MLRLVLVNLIKILGFSIEYFALYLYARHCIWKVNKDKVDHCNEFVLANPLAMKGLYRY